MCLVILSFKGSMKYELSRKNFKTMHPKVTKRWTETKQWNKQGSKPCSILWGKRRTENQETVDFNKAIGVVEKEEKNNQETVKVNKPIEVRKRRKEKPGTYSC